MARKMMSKGERKDSLYEIAGNFKALSDTTFAVPVKDHFDSEPWKERCFRLGYFVMMDNGGEISNVDTLYMMIHRVSRPLKYLENDFDPYAMKAPEEAVRSRRAVNRRLVLQGKYDGHVPEVLKDSSYILTEMHVKTKVLPLATYEESMNAADVQVKAAMADLRSKLASKMDENVRVTMTSEIDEGLSEPFSTEYRLILRQDNADARLTSIGYKIGLISEERYSEFLKKEAQDLIDEYKNNNNNERIVIDYIAGMTDDLFLKEIAR